MATDHELLFILGSAAFCAAGLAAALLALIMLAWRRRFSSFIQSAVQCFLMALVYALMAFDWWQKQRKDGREFPWYRDVAQIVVFFLQTWMISVALWLDKVDAFTALGATFCGAAALAMANFTVANIYWFGWSAGVVVFALCAIFIAITATHHNWRSWAVLLSGAILWVGLPLAQLLSWTMTGALDDSPHNFNSEIFYLVVTFVGIVVSGLASGLLYVPKPMEKASASVPSAKLDAESEASATQQTNAAINEQPRATTMQRRKSPSQKSRVAASPAPLGTNMATVPHQHTPHIRYVN